MDTLTSKPEFNLDEISATLEDDEITISFLQTELLEDTGEDLCVSVYIEC